MFEFHGWFMLADNTEDVDRGGVAPAVRALRALLRDLAWSTSAADIYELNGEYCLSLHGLVNRRRQHEVMNIEQIIDFLIERLPGSYGLLYERSDEGPQPPGPGAFRVRVLARATVTDRLDPFLSPTQPLIED
jgi:hypothetical protein